MPNNASSYAAAVGQKSAAYSDKSFREIMMETKNEELTEEAERKRRAKNIIIHGVKEKFWKTHVPRKQRKFDKSIRNINK